MITHESESSVSASRHSLPKIIIGTSCLGNLYKNIGYKAKKDIIEEVISQNNLRSTNGHDHKKLIFDCAGKYGCGLALETLGMILKDLGVPTSDVNISNKLGWRRTGLNNGDPCSCANMEPGVWMDLEFDGKARLLLILAQLMIFRFLTYFLTRSITAIMDISYDGILKCFEEGNALLGDYSSSIVSVHDPDDFVDGAADNSILRQGRIENVIGAYKRLTELKSQRRVESIGIGVKNPEIIEQLLLRGIHLDWTMVAGVLTPYVHTVFVQALLRTLNCKGIQVINAAVFNAGFLVGENYYNYILQDRHNNQALFDWRDNFHNVCRTFNKHPAHVCVQFSFLFSEISSVALNACSPEHVTQNYQFVFEGIPIDHEIWKVLAQEQLIKIEIPLS
jgi:D-threo-aldose 1-dehydrogenase